VVDREKAEIGVLITFEEPTRKMREEAASADLYESHWGKHPRIQLLTVGELLEGKRIDYPQTGGVNRTYKKAPKERKKDAEVLSLGIEEEEGEKESPKKGRKKR
jgi:hypothetical protein